MDQSTYIVGALLLGFVLFLAARNRLGAYTAVLWGSTAAPAPAPSSATGSSGSGGIAGDIKTAATVAQFVGGF